MPSTEPPPPHRPPLCRTAVRRSPVGPSPCRALRSRVPTPPSTVPQAISVPIDALDSVVLYQTCGSTLATMTVNLPPLRAAYATAVNSTTLAPYTQVRACAPLARPTPAPSTQAHMRTRRSSMRPTRTLACPQRGRCPCSPSATTPQHVQVHAQACA